MVRSILLVASFAASFAVCAEEAEISLVIRDHRFEPAELRIPAGKKVRLAVRNQDSTPEEFESHELNREKVVPANGKVTIYVGPLAKGRYPFFGEFNPKTAVGAIVAE
jgi:plastocyanin